MAATHGIFDRTSGSAQERLALVVETMREMSSQTDPQSMVRAYARRMRQFMPADRSISLSRRGMDHPAFRITRDSLQKEEINPWRQTDRLPVLSGGILSELLYADQPAIINDLRLAPDDPAAPLISEYRSLIFLPLYDQGIALNAVAQLRNEPDAFNPESLPEFVWTSNLFGRATHNLVHAEELTRAYTLLDREMQIVAAIQRSLLPDRIPRIPTLDIAAHYQTSSRAGGDYYDFFALPDGRWGFVIADVSGHGTPAAVVMAITHSIAHTHPGPPAPPGKVLEYVNRHLTLRYTGRSGTFVTGFYGIYDPKDRTLTYASAGHNPPRVKRCACGSVIALNGASGLPLGLLIDETYEEARHVFHPGDLVVFYTDGITEAMNGHGGMFGTERLDHAISDCRADADEIIRAILADVERFAEGHAPDDDRTLLVARVS